MKTAPLLTATLLLCLVGYWAGVRTNLTASDVPAQRGFEYITIRWDGRDNTHLIRANGKVEPLGPMLTRVARPDRTDERAFYMNIAMNAAGREGYELVGLADDRAVMRRAITY